MKNSCTISLTASMLSLSDSELQIPEAANSQRAMNSESSNRCKFSSTILTPKKIKSITGNIMPYNCLL